MTGAAPSGTTPRSRRALLTDRLFFYAAAGIAAISLALIVAIGAGLFVQSALTRKQFGWSMLVTSVWDVVHSKYGALPYIYGTLVSSLLAILIAIPIGVGAAVFLAELAPRWLSVPISFMVELLAAVPSVIFGLWGFMVMAPWLQDHVNPWLVDHFGALPLFAGPPYMTSMLAAGVILAMMILPLVTAVSRDVMKTVPGAQREGALALGATRWEMVRSIVLPTSRSGITGAIILAFGRAVGETMAVVMVIGNNPVISKSLLQPGYTMPGLLANEFNEAYSDPVQRSALVEIALILFVVTLLINAIARMLILWMSRSASGSASVQTTASGRAGGALAAGAVWIGGALLALAILAQVVGDVKSHGIRGLLGPIEIAAALVLLTRLITRLTRETPHWQLWRKINGGFTMSLAALCAAAACVGLGLVLYYVARQGVGAINIHFFTELPKSPDDPTGGMKNAIVGTLYLVALASVIGVPAGIVGGIYLAEQGNPRTAGVLRFSADVLNGIPSVVIGMFAYVAFVLPFKHFSALAGGAALGIMVVPIVVRTTEEMLRLVPSSIREAALGLGATRTQAIYTVILPAARAGVVTGVMLAIARIAGETAPLLFTAFGNDQLSYSLKEPISSMTMMIYRNATAAYPIWVAQAWAAAVILLVFVLVLNLSARLLTRSRYALR